MDLNLALTLTEFAQGPWNVNRHRHNYFPVWRDLVVVRGFARDEVTDGVATDLVLLNPGAATEVSSTTAPLMQVTGGKPSRIFCHVRPSSLEPKSFPLRVPK